MKAKELAELLLQYPEHDVLGDGYEGGFSDLHSVVIDEVVREYYSEDYYGPHELLKELDKADSEKRVVDQAIILRRKPYGA